MVKERIKNIRSATLGFVVLSVFVFAGFWLNYHQVDSLRNSICLILDRQMAALPSNPYFKEHPDQLADAIEQVHASRDDINC